MSSTPVTYNQLRPITGGDEILNYVDDSYLIVPTENSTSCQAKLSNIKQWAKDNNLCLNPDKTLEIIFYSLGRCSTQVEPSPTNIQHVISIEALGVTISSQLSMNEHVSTLLDSCARTIYGLPYFFSERKA